MVQYLRSDDPIQPLGMSVRIAGMHIAITGLLKPDYGLPFVDITTLKRRLIPRGPEDIQIINTTQ